ncbi:hypothetical protein LZF95_26720, partial [Algoriphagus sp. AGSA1]|uniref:hypothetical protein n=1 Tax=Algoriphagus sp. AGSA1 TaxID=2907213 RepID=UPI001F38692D
MQMRLFRLLLPYISFVLVLGVIFYSFLNSATYRVGDGGEYYALYYAWVETLRPWMTASSFEAYEVFVNQSEILGHVSADRLASSFPSLRVGETADFNHFWLYSFLAFCVALPLYLVDVAIDAHHGFLLLHHILLAVLFSIVFRFTGWRGVLVVAIMTFFSPVLWYLNKVHTELYTYVFTLLAVVLFSQCRYLASSFCLAVASAQNPSFSLVAFVPFFYRVVWLRYKPFTWQEVFWAIGATVLVLLHPIYYFFRYGVPTPQLLAGGASLGESLNSFH